MRTEIRFSGLGGQGIILSGILSGKAAALFGNKHATMTQSFGPEARGSACSAQLVISDERIFYPYVTKPSILVAMSQEAYEKFKPDLAENGILILDADLVKVSDNNGHVEHLAIPATRFAEELGNRILANLVMLGFFSAATDAISPDSFRKAIPGSVPERFLDLNMEAFGRGHNYGVESRAKQGRESKHEQLVQIH